jgi:tetratricopeptide (TPR) repeat protein/NAD-dependent SIR2 family protein deacetylase
MTPVTALQQLQNKKRTYEDLSRFIGSRATGAPNYTMLMGAGCSISSGIRSAGELVKQWRKEVFGRLYPGQEYDEEKAREKLTREHAIWYNPAREYSSLFEKNFDLPRQRRMFVEQEVAGKTPGLGYAYLLKLVEGGFLNTLFTTNFDDLLNEAFFQFSSVRPMVCAQDSSISSITVTSKRPKIIKLHGDYLFDDIKSTVRETESLEENTRKKFIEFGRDFGLVVVGYSGCDRSVMDVMQYLLRTEDYFKHGVYWCLRKGENPSDELLKLLWRDRVYFVEIDGFDELMAGLHNDLVGQSLPVDTSVITDKPKSIIASFCDNTYLNDSSSDIVKRDLDRLRKVDQTEQILSAVREMKKQSYDEEGEKESLEDKDFLVSMEIRRLIDTQDIAGARQRLAVALESTPSRRLREELLDLKVMAEEAAGDLPTVLKTIDEMIEADPKEISNYLRKTYFVFSNADRIKVLSSAAAQNPYDARIFDRKFDCLVENYSNDVNSGKDVLVKEIEEAMEDSLRLNPSYKNPTWMGAIDFYSSASMSNEIVRAKLDELVDRISQVAIDKPVSFRARLKRWSRFKEDRRSSQADGLLGEIAEAKLRRSISDRPNFEWLEIDAFQALERNDDWSRRISELDINAEYSSSPEFLIRKSRHMLKFSGDLDGAIGCMKKVVTQRKRREDIMRLATLYMYAKSSDAISALCEKYALKLGVLDKVALKKVVCEARGDIDSALAHLRALYAYRTPGIMDKVEESHYLIQLRRYDDASTVAKSTLEVLQWNKATAGELIINFELAELRAGRQITKRRLSELIEANSSETVRACAHYLLGNQEKARTILVAEIRSDREVSAYFTDWAVFSDDAGKKFVDSVLKAVN